ncbi:hypothetical protein D3H55_23185, partial [Bacillus salacetis]
MTIIDKILQEYGKFYDPHNQIINSLKENNRNYIFLFIILIEAAGMVYLAITDEIVYALGAVFIYLTTIGLASYLHFKLTEKRYGSLEDFDLQKRKEFIENVCIRTGVDLNQEEENKLVESLLQRRLEKSKSRDQLKKTIYLGIATSILPLLITLFLQSIDDVIFLTIVITIIGFIVLIFSTRF